MEPLITYAEQRFGGKRVFQLFPGSVVVRGSESLSSAYEETFRLETLRPEFDRTWYRSPYFMSGVKQTIGSFIAVSVLHSGFGMSISTYLGALAAVGVVTGLLLLFAARQKVEYAVFKTQAGTAALSVARAGKQIDDYDEFIQRLVQQIQSCEQQPASPKPAA